MNYIIFQLHMPGNNAWNGRWSGEGKLYAIVKKFPNTLKGAAKVSALNGQSFGHNFGDGWFASVACRIPTDAKELRDVRKRSQGFCGYDWMVENILSHGSASDKKEPVEA